MLETHPDGKAQESGQLTSSDLLLPFLCWWSGSCFFINADQTSMMKRFCIMIFAEDTKTSTSVYFILDSIYMC